MRISSHTAIAALAAIGLNLTPGLAQAEFNRAMTDPAPTQSRVLAAEIASFRDGAESVRPLSDEINARVDEVRVSSGALVANTSAHEDRLSAARSEGVIIAMTHPGEMVEAQLNGMLVAYEVIDARVRLDPGAAPDPVPAKTLPSPAILNVLIDDRLGLPRGEAGLAGYERMMAAWADLGPSPAPAPIRTPEQEVRLLSALEQSPEMKRFFSEDLLQMSARERADRLRDLVEENPELERFVHGAVLEGSDLTRERTADTGPGLSVERVARFSDLIEENPRARQFFHETILAKVDAYRAETTDLSP